MRYFIFLLALAFTGCTSSGKDRLALGDPVPSSRLYSFEKRSDAQLVVSTDGSLRNWCKVRVQIDGQPAADMQSGEVADFWLTFGAHILSVEPSAGCDQRGEDVVKINVKSGDLVIKRIGSKGIFQAAN